MYNLYHHREVDLNKPHHKHIYVYFKCICRQNIKRLLNVILQRVQQWSLDMLQRMYDLCTEYNQMLCLHQLKITTQQLVQNLPLQITVKCIKHKRMTS